MSRAVLSKFRLKPADDVMMTPMISFSVRERDSKRKATAGREDGRTMERKAATSSELRASERAKTATMSSGQQQKTTSKKAKAANSHKQRSPWRLLLQLRTPRPLRTMGRMPWPFHGGYGTGGSKKSNAYGRDRSFPWRWRYDCPTVTRRYRRIGGVGDDCPETAADRLG